MKQKRKLLFFFIAIILIIACKNKSQGYSDCILNNLRKGMNKTATIAVINACREKYPQKNIQNNYESKRKLTKKELDKIHGRAKLSYNNTFSGEIYNGNEDIRVIDLKIKIRTKMDGKKVTRIYNDDITIEPQSTKNFYVDIITGDSGTKYDWGISSAIGVPVKN